MNRLFSYPIKFSLLSVTVSGYERKECKLASSLTPVSLPLPFLASLSMAKQNLTDIAKQTGSQTPAKKLYTCFYTF